MPEADFIADHAEVGFQPFVQVVEQRFERAQVEDRGALPVLVEEPGNGGQDGCLGFAASGGRDDQSVLARKNRRGRQFLQRPQPWPPQGIDQVVAEQRMKRI